MDDVMRGRLKGALIIKRADYMVVMRSVHWAQGRRFVGRSSSLWAPPAEFRRLLSFFWVFPVNSTQGRVVSGGNLLTSRLVVFINLEHRTKSLKSSHIIYEKIWPCGPRDHPGRSRKSKIIMMINHSINKYIVIFAFSVNTSTLSSDCWHLDLWFIILKS